MTMASNLRVWRITPLLLIVVIFCPFAYGKIIYVDDDATGVNDGSSWLNAFLYLKDAITTASTGDDILVAQGIYKPDQGIGITLGDKRVSFRLKSGVTIKGGYAGLSAQDPNARNVGEYETILSGDLNGNDVYVNDPYDLLSERTRAENSWNVMSGSNTDETAILDGFTITGGDVWVIPFGSAKAGGAGMFISSGSPTLIDCTFTDNVTGNTGGGLLIYDNSNPTLINCKFTRNNAESGGGGIFSSESSPTLINCTFYNNCARCKGGAMFNFRSNPELTDCIFSGNSIPDIPTSLNEGGGAMRNSDSNLLLNNCAFSDNTASYGAGMHNENNSNTILNNCTFRNNLARISGGGMFTEDSNDLRLIDCVFSGNSALSGGGISNKYSNVLLVNCIFSGNKAYDELRTDPPEILPGEGGGLYTFGNIKLINCTNCTFTGNWAQQGRAIAKSGTSDFMLTNCILWNGGNEIFDIIPNRITFDTSYSNIQNVLVGKLNINEDPLFADPGYWANADDPNIIAEPNDPNAVWIDGDYHLKSQAGRFDPSSGRWMVDQVTSPCIDAGDPNIPVGDETMPNGDRINMGAYGGTPEASKTYILATIIYVDDDAVGNNDGTNWENAYTFLQDALADAEAADKPVEIRVAQGVYKPNQRMPQTPGHGDNTFTLVNKVTVKGGYAGFGEADPNARDINICETILSGDLNGDDIIVEDPCDMLLVESNRGDNSRVVVRANHTNVTAVLDGFVITGGFFTELATGPPNGGAGMHIYQGSPTIRNCTFAGNAARKIGGGLLNRGGSNPTLINCAFIGNYAESGGGIYNTPNIPAPGMISEGSHPTLVNCTFENNCAFKNGGGIYNFLSNPTLTGCVFRSNKVIGPYSGSTRGPHTGGGGGMYNSNSSPVLTNCLFSENSAGDGGGICSVADSNVTLTDCTFNGNSASVIGGGLSNLENCRLTLTNCEFINNIVTGIGGGLANNSGNAMLVKCVFSGNLAHDWSMHGTSQVFSGLGGGMSTGSNSTLINCEFQFNYATEGAGMYLSGSPELIGCIFIGNSAIEDGGGIQNVGTSSEPVITNCIFSGNSANRGGGIFFTWGARMIMANCTFAGNSASIGKTLASEPMKPSLPGYINLINCILWDGDKGIFDPEPHPLSSAITYSDVQGGWPGEGNIDSDPCFADPGYWADADDPNIIAEPNDPNAVWVDGDYHLKSQAGRWDPVSQSWVQDDVTSPCIDTGDPNSPIGHEPFPNGGIINMGAYGGTEQASLSLSTIQVVPAIPP